MTNWKAIAILIIIIIVLTSGFLGLMYMDYSQEVELCCEGYRAFMLEGQSNGECYYWSFIDHLNNLKGCVVEDA